jgi:hypothetical protein
MPRISLFGGAEYQLRSSVEKLALLTDDEIRVLGESLESLTAPLGGGDIEGVARTLQARAPRLSRGEWENLVTLLLQLLTEPGFWDFASDMVVVESEQRGRLASLRQSMESRPRLAETLAKDRFLEQGPRLKRLTWFCELRTKFAKTTDTDSSTQDSNPQAEFTIPIVTIRLEVDEVESPVYFQLADTELRNVISALERAQRELRSISEKSGKRGEI